MFVKKIKNEKIQLNGVFCIVTKKIMCLQSDGRKLQNYDNATHFLFNKRLENKLGFLSQKSEI